jgi:hypothetical protein
MATLIGTAKLRDVDPQAGLVDVLARIAGMPEARLPELLPWNWSATTRTVKAPMESILPFARDCYNDMRIHTIIDRF